MAVAEKTMGQMLDDLGLETGKTMAQKTIEFYDVEKKAYVVIHMIESLIKTETDFHMLGANVIEEDHLYFALCNLRYRKLAENQMTIDEFLDLYEAEPIVALTKLFQENIRDWWYAEMLKKDISPEYIYQKQQERHRTFCAAINC